MWIYVMKEHLEYQAESTWDILSKTSEMKKEFLRKPDKIY